MARRLRKTWLEGAQFGVVGPAHDLTYPYDHLGDGPDALATLRDTRFFQALKGAQRPLVVLGSGVLGRPDRAQVLQQVRQPLLLDAAVLDLPWCTDVGSDALRSQGAVCCPFTEV